MFKFYMIIIVNMVMFNISKLIKTIFPNYPILSARLCRNSGWTSAVPCTRKQWTKDMTTRPDLGMERRSQAAGARLPCRA
jgi:hypothetical protein